MKRILSFFVAMLLCALSALAQVSRTFIADDTFTVPDGVSAVTIKAWGGGGGGGRNDAVNGTPGGHGGGGGFAQGTYSVTPGETLAVIVGTGGTGASGTKAGGGGGGLSVVSNSVTRLVLAAGGGGGGGGDNKSFTPVGHGGAGGGTNGVAGSAGGANGGGGGGSQTAGGAGGVAGRTAAENGLPGTALSGGNGYGPAGTWASAGSPGGGEGGLGASYYPAGGGGGAGWFGGGGGSGESGSGTGVGSGGGGGGGSSWGNASGTAIALISGSGAAPGNTTDADYVVGSAVGGNNGAPGTVGADGLVVIAYDIVGAIGFSDPVIESITADSAGAAVTLAGSDCDVTLYWEDGDVDDPASHAGWDGMNGPKAEVHGAVSRTLSGLTADTLYTYVFYGTNGGGSEAWSTPGNFVTALSDAQAPVFTSSVPATVSIRLGWQARATYETAYLLRRSTSPSSGPYNYIDVGLATSYTDSALHPETTYYYGLAATNSENGSVTSFSLAQTSATTLATVERFVSTNGSDTANSGLSWSSPYATIGHALAQGDAHTVTVSNGTYTTSEEIVVTDTGFPVVIRSFGRGVTGGIGNASLTVIDRGGSGSRVFKVTHAGAAMDGLKITGGVGTHGGGIYLEAGLVSHCIIEGNTATSGGGGGIHLPSGGSGVVSNCIIRGNSNGAINNDQSGGGVYAYSGVITHCQVVDNASVRYGGGISCSGADVAIRNSLIARNRGVGGDWGGGGGIYVWDRGPVIESCTIVSNVVTTADKGGGISHRQGTATVRNCIVYFNTAGGGADDYARAPSYATYTCAPEASSGEGNTVSDPMVADLAGGDYRLAAGSPCINAGANQVWMSTALDLGGAPRLQKGTVDMGAYEGTGIRGAVLIVR